MPHAVIGPGQSMLRIGSECLLVPVFGVVIAAELAAGIAEEGGDISIVVITYGPQRGDAALVVFLVINHRISRKIAVEEFFGRAALVGLLLGVGLAGRLIAAALAALRRLGIA